MSPDAGGIDCDLAGGGRFLSCAHIAHYDTFDTVAGAEEAGHLMIRDDVGAVPARVDHVGGCETERVHSPVGHFDRTG